MEIDYNKIVQDYFLKIRPILLQLRAGRSAADNMDKLREALSEDVFLTSIIDKLSNTEKENLLNTFREQKLNISQNIDIYEEAIINAYSSVLAEGIKTLEEDSFGSYTLQLYKFLLEDISFENFIDGCCWNNETKQSLLQKFHLIGSDPFKNMLDIAGKYCKEIQNFKNAKNKERSNKQNLYDFGNLLEDYSTFTVGYGYISDALNLIKEGKGPNILRCGYDFFLYKKSRIFHIYNCTDCSKEDCSSEIFVHDYVISIKMYYLEDDEEGYIISISKNVEVYFHEGFRNYAFFLIWAYLQSHEKNKFDNICRDIEKYKPFFGITEIEEGEIEED